jgi:hypothetical protein
LELKLGYDEEKYYLGNHESLLCIHTVLSILSGQGEALTMDPERFYNHLDRIIGELTPSNDTLEVNKSAHFLKCNSKFVFFLIKKKFRF